MSHPIDIGNITMGSGHPLTLVAGPCVLESYDIAYEIASYLKNLTDKLGMPFVFKASYDKANRTAVDAFRGPGIVGGLEILSRLKSGLGIKVISDVHQISEVGPAVEVLDMLQIPALLSRQTDLIQAAARAGKPLNIKKGQFLAPWDMANVLAKARATGNQHVCITERGAMFGYNNLVVDFRGIRIMQADGSPVVFDATHSVQLPGGAGSSSGGQREYAPVLARAAVAAGADGVFLEVHKDPDQALCDGPNSLRLDSLPGLLPQLQAIRDII